MQVLKKVMFWIFCLLGIVFLKVGFIFFLLAFLPTIVTFFVDDSPKKDFYKTVRACNFAGMVPTVVKLFERSYPAAELQLRMTDAELWLMIYASAAAGWVLVWLCRWAAYVVVIATSETRIVMLERGQKLLVEEWGSDITRPV